MILGLHGAILHHAVLLGLGHFVTLHLRLRFVAFS